MVDIDRDEPFDAGGTPSWRANQKTWAEPPRIGQTHVRQMPPVMAASRHSGRVPFWRRWNMAHWMLAMIALGFGLPVFIVVGGILGAYGFDRMMGW